MGLTGAADVARGDQHHVVAGDGAHDLGIGVAIQQTSHHGGGPWCGMDQHHLLVVHHGAHHVVNGASATGGFQLFVHQGVDLLAVGILRLGDAETAQQAGDGGLADVGKAALRQLAADLFLGAVAVLADDLATGIQLGQIGLLGNGTAEGLDHGEFL